MASILDDLSEIKKLDQSNILRNIQEFPFQCQRCFEDFEKFPLPTSYIQAKNVLIAGMGGSGIGGAIALTLAKDSPIPIAIWSDYQIPGYLSNDTLVIAVSYSGGTEEVIDFLKRAGQKTRKIITISTGGKIESLASNFRTPHYKINYGSEPRAALGYLLMSVLVILRKLDLWEISLEDFRETMVILKGLQKKIDLNYPTGSNAAKILAQKLFGKIPLIYGSGVLSEVGRRWKGEFNENAKTCSYFDLIPELNHNSIVGLKYPKDLKEKIFVVILQSKFDLPRNRLRQNLTAQILERNRIDYDFVLLEPAPTPLASVLETIHFGDYVSFYLAMLNKVEPSEVTTIKFLKDKLAEKPME